MKFRFDRINDLLSQYSLGNFDYSIPVSDNLDEIDTIILGINMLGEELKATTISKNYFNDIFNSVSDMVFVFSTDLSLQMMNETAIRLLGYTDKHSLIHHFTLFKDASKDESVGFLEFISNFSTNTETEATFVTRQGAQIPVLSSYSKLKNIKGEEIGSLLVAKDITKQKESENLIIRTIVNTQEKERTRVAKDLHDSLGQQLSAIKFYLGTLQVSNNAEMNKELIVKSNDALLVAIQELRNICFNIMPSSLQNSTLIEAIHELTLKLRIQNHLQIVFEHEEQLPAIDKSIEIALYRIVQEFINNTIKHAEASRIQIHLFLEKQSLHLNLDDNGKGFDFKAQNFNGMGLKNIESRVKSFGGKVKMKSELNKGTSFAIQIPNSVQ
jgi:PAS domain S-box-containing protein